MVNSGNFPFALIHILFHLQLGEQVPGADLDAVAQTDGTDIGVPLHIAGEHGHRIGVIDEKSVGAELLHVFGKTFQHRNGPQGTENAADSQRICNGLAQPILFGNLKVGNGTGIIAAHLNGVADIACSPSEPLSGPDKE